MFPLQFANIFLTNQTFVTNLHLLRVELRYKLQEKLHRMTGYLVTMPTGEVLEHDILVSSPNMQVLVFWRQ